MIRDRVWVRRPSQTAAGILVPRMRMLFASCAHTDGPDIAFAGLTEGSE